ncbi:MAG: hypothetical protein RR582_06790 [Niameybacter sp.]
MAKVVKKVEREEKAEIMTWDESDAREFLLKGGIVRTKVTNYDKDGNVTSSCITEKQVAPNYRLHLIEKEPNRKNKLNELKSGLK